MTFGAITYKVLIITVMILSTHRNAAGQSDQPLADFFRNNPQANLNGDGKLTREEARAYRRNARSAHQGDAQTDFTRGDDQETTSHIQGIGIPESISPPVEVKLKSRDGVDLNFAYRKPVGEGPFPIIVFLHGGGGYSEIEGLKRNLMQAPVQTRFLSKGFMVAAATRRPYWKTAEAPGKVGFFKAVEDTRLILEKVKNLPTVNPENIILYGGSGGGILAIATAAQVDLACAIAGEPATVLLLKPMDRQQMRPDYNPLMKDPLMFYQGEVKAGVRRILQAIRCPVLLLQGDVSNLYKINGELLIPELKELGKSITVKNYPGLEHGFYWGSHKTGITVEQVDEMVEEVTRFITKHTTPPPRP